MLARRWTAVPQSIVWQSRLRPRRRKRSAVTSASALDAGDVGGDQQRHALALVAGVLELAPAAVEVAGPVSASMPASLASGVSGQK